MAPVDRRELAALFAGGFVGTLARLGLVEAFPHGIGEWPWSTFIANVVGAFALGWFATRLQPRPGTRYRQALLGPGLCGALTTFSTMQLELVHMLDGSEVGLALTYAIASIALGLAAVAAASRMAGRERPA